MVDAPRPVATPDVAPITAGQVGDQYFADDARRSVSIQQMVGVYPADFDAAAAVDGVKHTIESCRNASMKVTTMEGEVLDFRLLPQGDSGTPEIVLWSLAGGWACDNAFLAAHNAAVEITACGEVNGYDVLPVARESLTRLEALADMRA